MSAPTLKHITARRHYILPFTIGQLRCLQYIIKYTLPLLIGHLGYSQRIMKSVPKPLEFVEVTQLYLLYLGLYTHVS
jgi:hypothetical protein